MAYSNNILNHVNNINNNGYTIIKNGIDLDLIDKLDLWWFPTNLENIYF